MTIARNIVGTIKVLGIACVLAFSLHTSAAGLGDLSATDTSSGLKEALTRGADIAVSQLGKKNGFLGDKRVKIPLPKSAQTAEKMMRTFGMKKQADELIDPRPWCEIVRQWTTFHPEFAYLPRKFKIAINGSKSDRAAIEVHDIGLEPVYNEAGELGFRVLVGGGLGRTPVIGAFINEFLL